MDLGAKSAMDLGAKWDITVLITVFLKILLTCGIFSNNILISSKEIVFACPFFAV
jgi:hypothetical protein